MIEIDVDQGGDKKPQKKVSKKYTQEKHMQCMRCNAGSL